MDLAGATSDLQPWLSVYQREKCRELLLVGITMILFSTFSEQALQLYKYINSFCPQMPGVPFIG